jgi:hypothetical protein
MESTANVSGYAFGADNPIYFIDPLGLRNKHGQKPPKKERWVIRNGAYGPQYYCTNCGDDEGGGDSWGGTSGGGSYSEGEWFAFVDQMGGYDDGFFGNGGGAFGTNGSDNFHSSGNGEQGRKNSGSLINYQPGDGITPQNIKKIKVGITSGETITLTFELGANATRGLVTVSTKNGLIKISSTAAQYANLAKAFGAAANVATGFEMLNNITEYNNGEIGGGRLAYRLTGESSSLLSTILTDAIIGSEAGPWGTVIGIAIGVATPLGEIFYDRVLVPAADKTKDWLHEFIINPIAHFESSLENWHP